MEIIKAAAVIVVFFLLGQSRFLDIAGVNPNLLLTGLLFFAFGKNRFGFLAILLAVSAFLAVLFTPVWFVRYAVIFLVVILFYFAKGFMTGNRFFDFLTAVALGTLIFYLIVNVFGLDLPYALIFGEIGYNLIVGALTWHGLQKITNQS